MAKRQADFDSTLKRLENGLKATAADMKQLKSDHRAEKTKLKAQCEEAVQNPTGAPSLLTPPLEELSENEWSAAEGWGSSWGAAAEDQSGRASHVPQLVLSFDFDFEAVVSGGDGTLMMDVSSPRRRSFANQMKNDANDINAAAIDDGWVNKMPGSDASEAEIGVWFRGQPWWSAENACCSLPARENDAVIAEWFRSPAQQANEWSKDAPAVEASDAEIASWFRAQPWSSEKPCCSLPASDANDAEVAGWFRAQPASAWSTVDMPASQPQQEARRPTLAVSFLFDSEPAIPDPKPPELKPNTDWDYQKAT